MFNVYNNQLSRQTGSRNLMDPKTLPMIWGTYMKLVTNNYWWQKSDIWSQPSYRYPISREAFLNPSDSYFLFADLVGFYSHWTYMRICRHMKLVTKYQISAIISFWEKCDEKCAYMFNVYKNQISWQTGNRNLTGHKLHIGTPYRGKRFWTHQIPTSCLPILLIFIHI
jgi:hypothetical protein